MSFVVDASVVAKYLVADVESDKAEAFLREWTQARFDLLAPEILPMEVASTLWKRVRRGLVPADKACTLYDKFIRLCIPLMPIEDLAEPALRLALPALRAFGLRRPVRRAGTDDGLDLNHRRREIVQGAHSQVLAGPPVARVVRSGMSPDASPAHLS
ncbi:MAG: hypothetical protein DMG24_20670 [Acidobacteria bacterium]|nr:MAG: hypothetical protein DMG24_20670 [Acidobacteriota bacterium]